MTKKDKKEEGKKQYIGIAIAVVGVLALGALANYAWKQGWFTKSVSKPSLSAVQQEAATPSNRLKAAVRSLSRDGIQVKRMAQ